MRSRLRYAAIAILIASVPVVLMVLAASGEPEPGMKAEPLSRTIGYGAVLWYPWAILAPFIDRLVRRSRPHSSGDRARTIAAHAALALVFITVHAMLMHAVTLAYEPQVRRTLWRAVRGELLPDSILYSA